jgi:hypothetical protein
LPIAADRAATACCTAHPSGLDHQTAEDAAVARERVAVIAHLFALHIAVPAPHASLSRASAAEVCVDQSAVGAAADAICGVAFVAALVRLQQAVSATLALLASHRTGPAFLDLAGAAAAIAARRVAIVTTFARLAHAITATIAGRPGFSAAPTTLYLTPLRTAIVTLAITVVAGFCGIQAAVAAQRRIERLTGIRHRCIKTCVLLAWLRGVRC